MATSSNGISSTSTSAGLGTGIDIATFVNLALTYDQANITRVQDQQTTLSDQTKALTRIMSELSALEDAAYALNDPLGALNAQTATSSNSSVLSATATTAAMTAVHTISVNSLATTSSYYTNALASSSTAITAGSFQVQVGTSSPVTVTVDSTNNTLAGLASAINNQNFGVRASVVSDANGARLALVSETTGAPGDISISSNTTSLNFNKAVSGSNASLVVDGIPISSATNTVTGVINGVTLNLTAPSSNNPITLTVGQDTAQSVSAINQLVSAYNTAIKDINSQFTVAADGSGGGPLEADGSLRQAQSSLLSAIAYAATGNNGIVNLASMGINLNNDGTLSVDSAQLQSALAGNSSGVQQFLQAATTGFASNLVSVLSQLNDPAIGALGLDSKNMVASSQDLSQQLSDLQAALSVKRQSLIQVYSQVNTTLQELPLLQSQLSQQLSSLG